MLKALGGSKGRASCASVLGIALCLVTCTSCGAPFRVPERVRIPPGSPSGRADAEGISVSAFLLSDEDQVMELFHANLRLAHLLPIYVELVNMGRSPLEMKRIQIEALDQRGRSLASLPPRAVIKRLYQYYNISFYPIASRKEFEAQFKETAFDLNRNLASGERRQGFIFLDIPREFDALVAFNSLTLIFRRIRRVGSDEEKSVSLVIGASGG